MRAEAQAHIDQINAATALLRRFLDWDRANRRLQELNAKVEDSALWDNPKAAQEVMRERQRLEQAIAATRAIERELSDTAELIELAESEGDTDLVEDGIRSLAELADRAERDKVAALQQQQQALQQRQAASQRPSGPSQPPPPVVNYPNSGLPTQNSL